MNMETILMVLAVVLTAVINVILPRVRRHQESGQFGDAEPELRGAPASVPSASPPEPETCRNTPIMTIAPMAPASARPVRRSRLGSLSGMRNGIVLAAVPSAVRARRCQPARPPEAS